MIKQLKNIVEYTKIYTSIANGNLIKGIVGGSTAWLSQFGVLTKVSLGLAGLVTSSVLAFDVGKDLRIR